MAGLDLRSAASLLRGSKHGPVVVKGSAAASRLLQRISAHEMPPAGTEALTDSEVRIIGEWIDSGAEISGGEVKEQSQPAAGTPAVSSSTAQPNTVQKSANAVPVFARDVQPIFAAHCTSCHAGEKAQASLDLSSMASLLQGSKNGPVVVKTASERSYLIQKVRRHEMPPPGAGKPLAEDQIVTIARWIDVGMLKEGAEVPKAHGMAAPNSKVSEKDRQFWSFIKPVRSPVPAVKNPRRIRTPLDGFILAKLESKGLAFAPDAAKQTLMRRAYFDLLGLPPSPAEVHAFMADARPDAYERLIDQLLASPHYGERWGRHWLDAVGYADTKSIDNDQALRYVFPNTGIWRYRDYVVRAFNQDKPYDRFLTEQLAGDELVDWRNVSKFTPEIRDALIATGYLRNVVNKRGYDALFEQMEALSGGILGLSVKCARCHDHKYDPIPQQDYYRMAANFAPVFMYREEPKDEFLPDVSKAEQREITSYNEEIDRPLEDLNRQLRSIRSPHEKRLFEAKLAQVPAPVRADLNTALGLDPLQRTPVQVYLIAKFGEIVKVTPQEIDTSLSEGERSTCQRLQKQVEGMKAWRRSYGQVTAAWEQGSPTPLHLLYRGDVKTPGPIVSPGFLTVLCPPGRNDTPATDPKAPSSGRRLALSHWLTSRDHPLTARVMVNRIWQNHFGRGIVPSEDNFGRMGTPPTHPELLDWLAVDFMENGWKVKRLHKMIMTSTAYRQSSSPLGGDGQQLLGVKIDPANSLLWRMNLHRLEAEVVRDSVLQVAGDLDLAMGGPPLPLDIGFDALTTVATRFPAEGPFEKIEGAYHPSRRSLYVFARRNYPLTFLELFDFPIMSVNCTRRNPSATPLQSLALLNSEFMMDQAAGFAERVNKTAGAYGTTQKKIETAFSIALSRKPSASEMSLSETHLQKMTERLAGVQMPKNEADEKALASLCQMLMSTNEFLYIE